MRKSRRRKDSDDNCVETDEGDASHRQLNWNYNRKKSVDAEWKYIRVSWWQFIHNTLDDTGIERGARKLEIKYIAIEFSLIQQRSEWHPLFSKYDFN